MSDPTAEAELARLRAEAELAEARLQAAQARAALAAAEAAHAGSAPTPDAAATPDATEPDAAAARGSAPDPAASGPLSIDEVAALTEAYAFAGAALDLGALVNGEAVASAQVRIPLAMTNRHGLVAGATGTGKTRTLQLLAEQLSAHGVAVFAADIKGDLSGVATPGPTSSSVSPSSTSRISCAPRPTDAA